MQPYESHKPLQMQSGEEGISHDTSIKTYGVYTESHLNLFGGSAAALDRLKFLGIVTPKI